MKFPEKNICKKNFLNKKYFFIYNRHKNKKNSLNLFF